MMKIFIVLAAAVIVLSYVKCDPNNDGITETVNSQYQCLIKVASRSGENFKPPAAKLVREWFDELDLSRFDNNLVQARIMKEGFLLFEMETAVQAMEIVERFESSKLNELLKAEQTQLKFFDDFPHSSFEY